jgi:hypothetical protein
MPDSSLKKLQGITVTVEHILFYATEVVGSQIQACTQGLSLPQLWDYWGLSIASKEGQDCS